MRLRHSGILGAAAAVLLAPSALAQAQAQPGNVGSMYWSWARAGQVQQYEAGAKRHADFHRQKGDRWTWYTWQVISGNRGAQYLHGTFWHNWKDFDNPPVPPAEDDADYFKNIEPYEASWRGEHVVYMPEHSYPPDSMDPDPLLQVWLFELKPGTTEAFLNAIKKIPEAAKKGGVTWRYTFWSVADGGSTPAFYVSSPLKNWAQLDAVGTPFPEVLAKAYGRAEAQAIMRALDDAIAHQSSMVLQYRADLSYVPAAAAR